MKKTCFLIGGLFILFVSLTARAQENSSDFFMGKWKVTVIGTPNGDAKFGLSIEKKDGVLEGVILNVDGSKSQKANRITTTDKSLTVYWFAEGYDVYLTLTKNVDGNVDGTLMDMFTSKIERVVE